MLVCFFDRDRVNFLSHYLQVQYGFKCKGYFAFIKQNPVPQARKVKFMNGWEVAVMLQKPDGALTFNYENGQQPDYIFLPVCNGNERTEHPTQKPLKAIYPFIRYFTNKNDLILDPFAGSGTTAVAARNLGRRFIVIEREPRYVEIIRTRLAEFNVKHGKSNAAQGSFNL
ncbi:MAG: site-specific DNA-methyltransferase [Alphaproteobacteria bacterium]|nr:site-specific DNA-methyltransferase [Alphaproteobacteria bacterium]